MIHKTYVTTCVGRCGHSGEALSSICQLVASFSVVTRTSAEEIGTLLEFDTAGNLVRQVRQSALSSGGHVLVMIEELMIVAYATWE